VDDRPFSDISYEQFLKEERLMGSTCKECGALYVPPRPVCIKCHSSEMEWVESGGRGKLAAFTSIAVCPPHMIEEGYNRSCPYVSGVVELEEGPRVVARIEGVDGTKPETIKIGTPLQSQFLHRGAGEHATTVLAFRPS